MQRACSQKCAAYVARHCLQAVDRFKCAQEAFLLVFHQVCMYIAYTRCKHAAKIALHILLGTACTQSTDFSSHKKRFFLFFTKNICILHTQHVIIRREQANTHEPYKYRPQMPKHLNRPSCCNRQSLRQISPVLFPSHVHLKVLGRNNTSEKASRIK